MCISSAFYLLSFVTFPELKAALSQLVHLLSENHPTNCSGQLFYIDGVIIYKYVQIKLARPGFCGLNMYIPKFTTKYTFINQNLKKMAFFKNNICKKIYLSILEE